MDRRLNTFRPNKVSTVVLVGRTGNGKSATGNTIIGEKVFKSQINPSGVTATCKLHTFKSDNGRTINVIDTPGLFEYSVGSEQIVEEIMKCVEFARDGIHALLLVLSVKNRFSKEEVKALHDLQALFGGNMFDYMILVFTGGDELEDNDISLENYLTPPCPEPLQNVVELCGNRKVLFDNRTKDRNKKQKQVQILFDLVDGVVRQNGGKAYKNELINRFKDESEKFRDQQTELESRKESSKQEEDRLRREYEQKYKWMMEMIQESLRERVVGLERRLGEEQAARVKADTESKLALEKSKEEILMLKNGLENAKKETNKLREQAETQRKETEKKEGEGCVIL